RNFGFWHQQRPADVARLEFHPVVLGCGLDGLSMAGPTWIGRMGVQLLRAFSPERSVKPDMAIFMAKSEAKTVLIAWVRKPRGDLHSGPSVEKEVGVSVLSFGQVRIHIEVVGFCLNHPDYVVRGNRQSVAAGVA